MNRKPFVFIGIALLIAGALLLLFGSSSRENNEVRWYKREGLQMVNGQAQYRLGEFKPADGQPSLAELEQLLAGMDFPLNQRVDASDPGFEALRAELYKRGYKDLGVNLAAIEVVPAGSGVGRTAGIAGIVLGLLAAVAGLARRDGITIGPRARRAPAADSEAKPEPGREPCPNCGTPARLGDLFCINCGAKLSRR